MSCKSIVIDGIEFVAKKESTPSNQVLIRTYSAGVHFGELKKRDGMEVVLANARRIWSWMGANTLSEIANNGCKGRISEPVSEITLTQAIEIIPITAKAAEVLAGVVWTK